MVEYKKKFTQLVKYSLNLVVTEQERCRQFEKGLRKEIRTPVVMISVQCDYIKLVNVALLVKRSLSEKRSNWEISDEEVNEEKESVRKYKKPRTTMG